MYQYNSMSDKWFIVICLGLMSILIWLMYTPHYIGRMEHFQDIIVTNHLAKLATLPDQVKDILIPQFNYAIDSVNSGKVTNDGGNDEEVIIEPDPYISSKDMYVVEEDGKINDEKFVKLKQEYKAIDDMLRALKTVDENLYYELLKGYMDDNVDKVDDEGL
jgi:hypothetical protein